MKLAKKVLSVVLALVLALSAFAVVGSANGDPDTATHHAKVWLTGSVGSAVWSSNSKVTITEGDESEAGGTLEVQPGQHVFVRLYVTNDYYVHTFQANLFYSSALIDAFEDYHAQRPTLTSKMTAANQKKIHIWNNANEWVSQQGTSYAAYNAWSYQNADFNADVEQNWPTDDEGNNLFNIDEWKFNRLNNLVSEGVGWTNIWEDADNHLIMMAVKVPETAEPGDTFYVTIPEGTEQREAKPKGALRLYENGIADGEEEVGETVDTQSSLNPNMKYGDEYLYWDLSEATLTLQVPGGSTEPELDYTNIDAALDAASKVDRSDKTAASLAALAEAINEAADARLNATEQTALEEAATALNTAIANLKVKADYSALDAEISRYEAIADSSIYPAADWAVATEKYNAAKAVDRDLAVDAQATVSDAAAALKAALDALAALDYSALEAKYNELAGKDVANYTDETVGRFNTALAAAKALIDNKNAANQAEINAAYDELVAADAALALKPADYTALKAAIAKYEALDAKAWTSVSFAAATEKYEAAKGIPEGLDITAQPEITAAAEALEAAITALVPATGANYNELNAAKAEFEALVADYYTVDSYAAAKTAYDAACEVPADLTSEQQGQIDEAAAALKTALGKLVEADADYSKVDAAIISANAILNKKDGNVNSYSDATLDAINEAKATVVTGLKKKDQDKVDAMAAAINAAISTAEFRAWDYSKILAHIEAIEANPADYYKASSYAAYLAKKDALVWNYTYEFYAKAMLQEINFLKVTVEVAGPADYSAVEGAIAAYEAKKAAADYTEDSIAAVDAEIAKVVYGLNENHQDEVDAFAAAINAAIDAMVEVVVVPADYTAVNDAIAAFRDKIAAADYEQDGIDAVEAIIADIDWNLDETAQDTVDAYAADIIAATEALVEIIPVVPADYTALDAAILRAGTYDQNVWTADTWAVVEEKLAAANAVARDLTADDQDQIDDAAKALNDALDALVAKEVVSKISTINYVRAEDGRYDITVVVTDRVAMVQFMEENGGTRTYDRYHKNVTVKSYNAEGVEVNALSRDVAYEIWSIHSNLTGPSLNTRTKFLEGSKYVWETEKYAFELAFDVTIHSIEPAATSGKKGAVVTTVVTGADVQAVQFLMADGSTTSYSADKAEVLDNGTLKFTGKAWANDEGLNTITVRIKYNNGKWTAVDTFDYTVE